PTHYDPHPVPRARRIDDPRWGRIDAVIRAGGGETGLGIGVPLVVQHLHLRPAPVGRVVVLADAIEDTAVDPLAYLPVECQLEVRELLPRHDVPGPADARERAIHHLPPRRHRIRSVRAPAGG